MKTKKCIWSLLLVICCLTSSAMASGLGDIRINARFLTDRMAFELNFDPNTVQRPVRGQLRLFSLRRPVCSRYGTFGVICA